MQTVSKQYSLIIQQQILVRKVVLLQCWKIISSADCTLLVVLFIKMNYLFEQFSSSLMASLRVPRLSAAHWVNYVRLITRICHRSSSQPLVVHSMMSSFLMKLWLISAPTRDFFWSIFEEFPAAELTPDLLHGKLDPSIMLDG